MTSPTPPAATAESASTLDSAPATPKKSAGGFVSLFSAAAAAAGKHDDQPWHQKRNKSAHEKKIGPAPNGTRRSMGKR